MAIYLITSHKKGISSLQLSKDLHVTQKLGLHILYVQAVNVNGDITDWIGMPYYIVESYSSSVDDSKPYFENNFEDGDLVKMGQKLKLKAIDNESGIEQINKVFYVSNGKITTKSMENDEIHEKESVG